MILVKPKIHLQKSPVHKAASWRVVLSCLPTIMYPHSSDCKAVVLTAIHESNLEGRASLGSSLLD